MSTFDVIAVSLPFTFKVIGTGSDKDHYNICTINNCKRGTVAEFVLQRDAEFIVHACNTYPDLMDALSRLVDDVENKFGDPHTLREAKEALAKARDEKLPAA